MACPQNPEVPARFLKPDDQLAPVARPGEAGFNDATGNGPAHPDNDEEVDPYLTEHGIEAPRA